MTARMQKNGLEGTLVQDLRRSLARNLSQAVVPEALAMESAGNKTCSRYRRYCIVDGRDLLKATENYRVNLRTKTTPK